MLCPVAPFSFFHFHKLLMQFQMEREKTLRHKATPTSAAAAERTDPSSCLWEGLHNPVIAPSLGSSRSTRAPRCSSPVCGWEGGQTACGMTQGHPECQILVISLLTTHLWISASPGPSTLQSPRFLLSSWGFSHLPMQDGCQEPFLPLRNRYELWLLWDLFTPTGRDWKIFLSLATCVQLRTQCMAQ